MVKEHSVVLNIKRYDLNDSPELETATLKLNSDINVDEALEELNKVLNLTENNTSVVKLRLEDNTLVPVTVLLDTNTIRPFNVEVTRVHQNLPAQNRTHLHAVYLEAVKSKIQTLNRRLSKLETLIPQARIRREIQNERVINNLSTKVAFLDRRLDELTPPEWKTYKL